MRTPFSLALLALALPVTLAGAQERSDTRFDNATFTAPLLIEEPASHAWDRTGAREPAVSGETAAAAGDGIDWRGVAHAVGGALVGGWIGYVGSQVVKGDWEKDSNGSFRTHRSLMAAAGALAGVLGSRLIGNTRSPGLDGLPEPRPRSDRILTLSEIEAAETTNAYELVATRRPQWLVVRGLHSLTESSQGYGQGGELRIRAGADKIIVYMNDLHLGGVAELRQISTDLLTSVRFLDAREATYRFGSGHTHGAIVLSTAVAAP